MNGPCLLTAQLLDLKRIAVWTVASLLTVLLTLIGAGCQSGPAPLTAERPLHLEEHLDAATIEGSEVPADVPAAVEWRFDERQPDWKPVVLWMNDPAAINTLPNLEEHQPVRGRQPARVTRTEDALRIVLTEADRWLRPRGDPMLGGGIYTDLPDWNREDWAYITVQARTTDKAAIILFGEYDVDLITDGTVQTYQWRADWSYYFQVWEDVWDKLVIEVIAKEAASVDILSVSVIPKEAAYHNGRVGVRREVRNRAYRRTLFTHAPGKLRYRVKVPERGRLDVGLGVLREDVPVTFTITAESDRSGAEILLEETHADKEHWAQRTIDLSHLEGQVVSLSLEADADRPGAVALWAAPTVSGSRAADVPNVIFYIIDAGGADYMSLYGYNRRTTPNLERLAAEGAVFERAHSNSRWTKPSTTSFMTSLQNSVLGGTKSHFDPLPDQAVTMAQHLHTSGYQTAVFVSNTYAGTISSLDRGVDVLREAGVDPNSQSSKELYDEFWQWREAYPGEPYWVHFQTTDVHWPYRPVPPFSGLFISPETRETFFDWGRRLATAAGFTRPMPGYPPAAFEKTGINRVAYYDAARSLYDEVMAHNDYQIGRLVDRLKVAGEWEHTLLIVASDHGQPGAGPDFGHWMLDSLPSQWWDTNLRSWATRIPLIVVWPERIAPGQRFSHPVSMIDMLPTILDLADLPMPEVMQGQSLAPLLLGEGTWEPRPVILDEFRVDHDSGELNGELAVIDGRWGASLQINRDPDAPPDRPFLFKERAGRPAPLLLYDLWNDPQCLHSLHEERPELVKKYTQFLEAQWEAHQALAQQFTRAGESPLTPEQIETLRSLGYVQ